MGIDFSCVIHLIPCVSIFPVSAGSVAANSKCYQEIIKLNTVGCLAATLDCYLQVNIDGVDKLKKRAIMLSLNKPHRFRMLYAEKRYGLAKAKQGNPGAFPLIQKGYLCNSLQTCKFTLKNCMPKALPLPKSS